MNNYNYQKRLQELWTKAVELYTQGFREADSIFSEHETRFLDSIGITPQEVYDFAEDFVNSGEPDFATFAMIHDIRKAYYHEIQRASRKSERWDISSYPNPVETTEGISYLPRIAKKAWSKLTGELNNDIMYSCANDRAFLKQHDIHPAEFLRKTWETDGDPLRLANWIALRKTTDPANRPT